LQSLGSFEAKMIVFKNINSLKKYLSESRKDERKTGFVPTMGALHSGHIRLVERMKKEGYQVVCSIFVNPTQFNQKEDFEKYPRNVEKDIKILEENGCDVVFVPEVEEMYPEGLHARKINLDLGFLGTTLEAAFRPGHFEGVAEIVYRLFDIVSPDAACFGLKDFQQCKVVELLRNQYFPDIKLIFVPTVREENGLAMSSRNQRLSPEGRIKAAALYRALEQAVSRLKKGESFEKIRADIEKNFLPKPDWKVEYFELRNAKDLQPLMSEQNTEDGIILTAAWLEGVRLIDNLPVRNDGNLTL
jgi:pantoate--beta-alanine ligase